MRRLLFATLLALIPLAATGPSTAAAQAATKTVTLAVENMSCPACPITVRKALQKVPGVSGVKVDLASKTATVTYDPARTNVDALTKATTDAGYPSTPAR